MPALSVRPADEFDAAGGTAVRADGSRGAGLTKADGDIERPVGVKVESQGVIGADGGIGQVGGVEGGQSQPRVGCAALEAPAGGQHSGAGVAGGKGIGYVGEVGGGVEKAEVEPEAEGG